MLTRLARVQLVVEDLAAALEDYERLLGRAAAWRGDAPDSGADAALLPLRNTSLELAAPVPGAGPTFLSRWLEANGEGVCGLVFETADLPDTRRRLESFSPGPARIERFGDETLAWRQAELDNEATRGIPIAVVEWAGQGAEPAWGATGSEARGGIASLDHVVIASPDVEAAARVYGDGLGIRLALDRSFEQRGVRLLFFRVGGVTVELAGSLRESSVPGQSDRFQGLAWKSLDVRAHRERLLEAGVDVSEHRAGFKPGTRVCTVRSGTHGVATLLIGPDE